MAVSAKTPGLRSSLSRRRVLKAAGSTAAITAAVGIAPRFLTIRSAHADTGLASGMVGGPTGFPGAERYQYGPDTPEARAIEALKAMVGAAFVLLTLTLATGMTLSESMFGRAMRLNHETVFAVMAWLTFAVLLWGRLARGWRGRTALRWTVAGFVMVLLANVGTAFVLEVLLRRG